MNQPQMHNTKESYKESFYILLGLIFLLPLFFLPIGVLPLNTSKSILLIAGVVLALGYLLREVYKTRALEWPAHKLLWVVLVLPLAYLVSALMAPNVSLSLLGYRLEPQTFGFVFFAVLSLALVSVSFNSRARVLKAFMALFLSLSLLALFALVKILSGGSFPVWGAFPNIMSNPVGSWTDYSMAFGLLSILSLLMLTLLPIKGVLKGLLWVSLVVSTALVAVINFSFTWWLLLAGTLLVWAYMSTVEKSLMANSEDKTPNKQSNIKWLPVVLAVVSLFFITNPQVGSEQSRVGDALSARFGIYNVEVRPSLSTTLNLSGQVLAKRPILGSGPNTFDQDWLLYKSTEINSSQFWNSRFPSGFGYLPTQIATVGLLGTLVWIGFVVLLGALGLRAFRAIAGQDRWGRFTLLSSFVVSFFLWVASFLYVPSAVVVSLAFLATGLFVGSCAAAGIIKVRRAILPKESSADLAGVIVLALLSVGVAALTIYSAERALAAHYYQQASVLAAENAELDEIESRLDKAVALVSLDIYYQGLAKLHVTKAQNILNNTSGASEEAQAAFQTELTAGVSAARTAVSVNPRGFDNWLSLGAIYNSLVAEPFRVEGAYEAALGTFVGARELNPTSPQVPLLLARLELNRGNTEGARGYINEALGIKDDYADAYFLLTQLELMENNTGEAIRSTETAALLSPNNAGVFLQLGLLKYAEEDWQGAGEAFVRALNITPDYQNAQYYLGLALYELDRSADALELFRNLSSLNPDNAELKAIVANLEAGNEPLLGVVTEGGGLEEGELPLE